MLTLYVTIKDLFNGDVFTIPVSQLSLYDETMIEIIEYRY